MRFSGKFVTVGSDVGADWFSNVLVKLNHPLVQTRREVWLVP